VILAALATAKRSLPSYSHRCSPKKFTQHQLFACLVLKSFLKTDYRGIVAHLTDCPSLVQTLGLKEVPHYTTLQKAARRLLASIPARRLLDATVREHAGRKRRIARAAIDSTGLDSTAASAYFVNRRRYIGGPWKTVVYHRYPKLSLVCDVDSHFILACQAARGPKVDIIEFQPLVTEALARVRLSQLAADAGYDSEANHRFARQECCIRSIIPPTRGRPTDKPASGRYRRLMQTRFDLAAYRSRVQVETVMSMIKRRLEAFVRGRNAWSQRRELRLKVLTHNVMLLLRTEVFYRAVLTLYSYPMFESVLEPFSCVLIILGFSIVCVRLRFRFLRACIIR
jgi:Transposase DDE domain